MFRDAGENKPFLTGCPSQSFKSQSFFSLRVQGLQLGEGKTVPESTRSMMTFALLLHQRDSQMEGEP